VESVKARDNIIRPVSNTYAFDFRACGLFYFNAVKEIDVYDCKSIVYISYYGIS
jgi:hypothetical protein